MQSPLYDLTPPNTARGLMAALWHGLLQAYASNDPALGVRIKDDFTEYTSASGTTSPAVTRNWSAADAAAAGGTYTLASAAGYGGLVSVGNNGTSNHYGIEVQHLVSQIVLPTHKNSAQGPFAVQFRFKPGTADTIFLGLSEAGDNFLSSTSGLPTDSDYAGFYSVDNGATWKFVCANDNNGGTAVTDEFTIPSDAYGSDYNNFGFRVNKDGSVEIGVNDNWYGPRINGISKLALPIETLTLRLSATAGNTTTAPGIEVDCVDCFVSAA